MRSVDAVFDDFWDSNSSVENAIKNLLRERDLARQNDASGFIAYEEMVKLRKQLNAIRNSLKHEGGG